MIRFTKKVLDAAARNKLSDSDFALPGRRYPIHDEAHARNALSRVAQNGNADEKAKVKAKVHSRYPGIGKQEKAEVRDGLKKEDMRIDVEIWKAEYEGKVYGVVLEPGLEDSQGDIVHAPEIEKACHDFMVQSRKADVQHNGDIADIDLIENYIAPQEMELAGKLVTKGSWIQGWQINDPVIKQEVEDKKLTGLSIAGSAVRVPA